MNAFVHKLRHGAPLARTDEALLLGLASRTSSADKCRDITMRRDPSRGVPLILTGRACRYQQLANGKRQVITLYLPGDLCEPFGTLPGFTDYPLGAITPVTHAFVSRERLFGAAAASDTCHRALWWDLLVAINIEREHIVSLGCRSAAERLAHLLCELELRLNLAGMSTDSGYEMPLTQADLGDLLGLTPVHVNRSLQDLRKSGLITLEHRHLTIREHEELQRLSGFDPTYLHVTSPMPPRN